MIIDYRCIKVSQTLKLFSWFYYSSRRRLCRWQASLTLPRHDPSNLHLLSQVAVKGLKLIK